MKIRAGFVSNSSSSCYIIKFDKDIDIENIIHCSKSCETKVKVVGIKDCASFFIENLFPRKYSCKDDFISTLNICSIIVRAAKDDKEVAIVNISYHDRETEETMEEFNIEKIYNVYLNRTI